MTPPREPVDAAVECRNARLATACGWIQGVYEAHWDGDGRPPSVRAGWARGPYTRADAADYDDDAQIYDLLGMACERGWCVDITVPRHGWIEVYAERTGRWQVAYGASSIGRALASCMLDGLSLDAQAACEADDDEDEGDG